MKFDSLQEAKQAAFNGAFKGLKHQGFKLSLAARGAAEAGCSYRGAYGTKCAIGWLIPESKYSKKLEGFNVYHLIKNEMLGKAMCAPLAGWLSSPDFADFLFRLQEAHDQSAKTELESRLRSFAENWGLSIPGESK